MASLDGFTKRIRALAKRTEENVDATVIKTAVAVNQTVVVATPVDTGRARANWQVELGAPATAVLEEEDKSGSSTIISNNAKAARRREGQDIFISNNVDYINELNDGSSAQAPAGFVERAVQVGVAAVDGAKVVK